MYIQEDKINNNKKAENNLINQRKTDIQDVRIREKEIQPALALVVQKKTAEEEVVEDSEVTEVKRGNEIHDVIATRGRSYYDVIKLRSVLNEFYVRVDKNKEQLEKLIKNLSILEPYIHAEMIRQAKVGNCVDFARLVYKKLVEKDSKKWIYQCYLDKKIYEPIEGRSPDLVVILKFNGEFNFQDEGHCKAAMVVHGKEETVFEKYINGNNPSRRKYEIASLKKEELIRNSDNRKYTFLTQRVEKVRQKYDHAFVITSPEDKETISELDKNEAIVVDAWAGINPKSLAQYLVDQDVENETLDVHDIKIAYKTQSTGLPQEYKDVREHVEKLMREIVLDMLKEDASERDSYKRLAVELEGGTKRDDIYDLKAFNSSISEEGAGSTPYV